MLQPKKQKFRKSHKGRGLNRGVATRITYLSFGSFGLKSLGHGWITSRQIEAARRVITRYVRRGGRLWIRIFPDKPVTRKGSEVPMGKGKGAPDHFVSVVKPGTIMFEIDGIADSEALEALNLAAYKLPVKCKVITK